ncbi:poly-beta-1,6-N-acetyl-D-glucosamine N-deacetylase PgaB [Aeromonas piscicola]|uniref:Poly-beta-1,6-N-acetyl-D-glucosamine N-deacetylase PgaB n=1 Tax=Aeromonas piscicola TaxID=600645 RepID=A0ABT7QE50_9GAMM|nr:poly-beta-1,6-N-acetyl-D-glucosamine N-deacetylase PgaB [Aeromonas piscicola]MDM5132239.1 poly-beta-1,6-N-acetyl-D-glucosamine N-deacetylase PgaB [Aeromonas piscicola]
MKRWLAPFVLLLALLPSLTQAARQPDDYVVLCYHDIVDLKLTPNLKLYPQTIRRDTLIRHFNWIKQQGYHPVSFQQILDAKAGKTPLPEKAILLSFDDGYESFYRLVYPLLKLYNYPAVFALVGSWLDVADDKMVPYGNDKLPRSYFVGWPQIREMQASGLVELASHTFTSHYGLLANPQGNVQPAVTTAGWSQNGYESMADYRARIKADFDASASQLREQTGRAPRILVWPYGAFNQAALELAGAAGMPYTFTLDEGLNKRSDSGSTVRRYLLEEDTSLETLDEIMGGNTWERQVERLVHVDLDYVYDQDPQQMNKNIDMLLDRIKGYGITTVYLQAYADDNGDGVAEALYFPNRHMPVKADLFNRVAWQLKTRTGVKVYAWMPVMAYDMGPNHAYVTDSRTGSPARGQYLRLSPWDPASRQLLLDIYEDLGFYTKFDGLLFHDDAFFSDYEGPMPLARTPDALRVQGEQKTDLLIDFTMALRDAAARYRQGGVGELKTARNIYAALVTEPQAQQWFAQSMAAFARAYDYTAVMAMPYMEQAENPDEWLAKLAEDSLAQVPANRLVFELQSRNWRTDQPIPDAELARWMEIIQRKGVTNFGYYPDDFHNNQPDPAVLKPVFSVQTQPQPGQQPVAQVNPLPLSATPATREALQ